MDSRADQISAHPRPMLGGKSSIFVLQLYIEFYSCPLSKKNLPYWVVSIIVLSHMIQYRFNWTQVYVKSSLSSTPLNDASDSKVYGCDDSATIYCILCRHYHTRTRTQVWQGLHGLRPMLCLILCPRLDTRQPYRRDWPLGGPLLFASSNNSSVCTFLPQSATQFPDPLTYSHWK